MGSACDGNRLAHAPLIHYQGCTSERANNETIGLLDVTHHYDFCAPLLARRPLATPSNNGGLFGTNADISSVPDAFLL